MKVSISFISILIFLYSAFVRCDPQQGDNEIQALESDSGYNRMIEAGAVAGATVSTVVTLIYLAPSELYNVIELVREISEELNRSNPVGTSSLGEHDVAIQSAVMVLMFVFVVPVYYFIIVFDIAGGGALLGAAVTAFLLKSFSLWY